VAAQVTGSAAKWPAWVKAFGQAVQLFSRSSEQLMAQLQRIESALGHSMARSDEQLAYYVAQAREIVDLTLGSQKQIVEDLQQLGGRASAPVRQGRRGMSAPDRSQPSSERTDEGSTHDGRRRRFVRARCGPCSAT
jgi:hypothetical protein